MSLSTWSFSVNVSVEESRFKIAADDATVAEVPSVRVAGRCQVSAGLLTCEIYRRMSKHLHQSILPLTSGSSSAPTAPKLSQSRYRRQLGCIDDYIKIKIDDFVKAKTMQFFHV